MSIFYTDNKISYAEDENDNTIKIGLDQTPRNYLVKPEFDANESIINAQYRINRNTDNSTGGITGDVNANTDLATGSITTDVNANTNTETGDIKSRISNSPIKRYAINSNTYTSYTTLFSYYGAGVIESIYAAAYNTSTSSVNVRYATVGVIIDGVSQYYEQVEESDNWRTGIIAGGLLQYDISNSANLLETSAFISLLGLPFASSIEIKFMNYSIGGNYSGFHPTNTYSLIIREA